MATDKQLQELLDRESCDKYYITLGHKTRFNHAAQALVALHALKFSYDDMQTWIQQATSKPGLVELKTDYPDEPDTASVPIEQLKGKLVGFYRVLSHYKTLLQQKYNNDLDDFVSNEFPPLADGLASFLLHALLQIGYGYAARNAQVTCEGMAFLFLTYEPIKLLSTEKLYASNLGGGKCDILDVLNGLPNIPAAPHPKPSPGIQILNYLSKEFGDLLLDQCDRICIDQKITSDTKALSHWLLTEAVKVFSMCEARNNFFVMHVVSSSWALSQLLPLFNQRNVHAYIRAMLCAFFMVQIDQDSPRYSRDVEAEKAAHTLKWSELIPRTTHSKNDAIFDAHVIKLVAICRQLCDETSDPADQLLYKTAACQCVDYPFSFDGKGKLSLP